MSFKLVIFIVLGVVIVYGIPKYLITRLEMKQYEKGKTAIDNKKQTLQREISKDVVYSISETEFIVDEHSNTLWLFIRENEQHAPLSSIIGCEVIIDDEVAGGIGRAVAGAVIAGGVGAIVGAVTAKKFITSYKFRIYTSDMKNSVMEVILISSQTEKSSPWYQNCVEFTDKATACIKAILHNNEKEIIPDGGKQGPKTNNFDELIEYKKLLDAGVISEEEFQKKKEQILK